MQNAEYIARLRMIAEGPNAVCAAWAAQALREVGIMLISGTAPPGPTPAFALVR